MATSNNIGQRLGAHVSWANTADRPARTAPARKVFDDQFFTQAREMFPDLNDAEIAVRAEHLRKAHFLKLALASAKARAARKSGGAR